MLQAQNSAFKSSDRETLRTVRVNLNRAIRLAKRAHHQKIQDQHQEYVARHTAITSYRIDPPVCEDDAAFLSKFNIFFERFDAVNSLADKAVPH